MTLHKVKDRTVKDRTVKGKHDLNDWWRYTVKCVIKGFIVHCYSSHSWNSLFLGANAVADVLAEKYNASKSDILDNVSHFLWNVYVDIHRNSVDGVYSKSKV